MAEDSGDQEKDPGSNKHDVEAIGRSAVFRSVDGMARMREDRVD